MAASGIQSIDSLLDGSSTTSISSNDHEAVGATQALLIGHGHHELPKVLAASYGTFGPQTTSALSAFQGANGLPVSAAIDAQTLQALISVAAVTPLASRAYATLVLDVAYTGLLPVATVTMQFEGGGFSVRQVSIETRPASRSDSGEACQHTLSGRVRLSLAPSRWATGPSS